jgi:multiple sugar transport system permease protein
MSLTGSAASLTGSRRAEARRLHSQSQARHLLTQAVIWLVLGIGMFLTLIPTAWMVFSSFKTLAEVQAIPFKMLPNQWLWENYTHVLRVTHMDRAFINSLILATTAAVVIVLTSSWGGYVFSKLEWPGRDKVLWLLISTMMIPGFLTLIPRYVVVIKLGLVNSFAGIIVPGLISTWGIFLTRQFMLGIPKDLTDAATVDGCNVFDAYWRVLLPLCTPVLAVLAIFTFDGSWNSLLWPMIVLLKRELWTIPIALNGLRTQEIFLYHYQMAGASIATIPVIITFLFLQRYIIQGVALSGLKG